jgi:hypothetical protein
MISSQGSSRHFRSALCALACLALLLVGCEESDAPPPPDPADSTSASSVHPEIQTLAQRFLRYSYRGAMLSSSHPLNDSLQAFTSYSGLGSEVMLVDTFSVESVRSRNDSVFVAQVRFPHALMISSDWQASDPAVDVQRSLQIQSSMVTSAPRTVGWPALRAHILDIRPEKGQATVQRIQERFEQLEASSGV